jgi:hypothetical protein
MVLLTKLTKLSTVTKNQTMRKLLLIAVLVCFAGGLFAANPIPSYNVLVNGRASFLETVKPFVGNAVPDAKRMMNIQTSTGSPGMGFSTVFVYTWVYRLDGTVRQGPYYIAVGQTISVQIDFTSWGVDVVTQAPSRISVWTSTDQQN